MGRLGRHDQRQQSEPRQQSGGGDTAMGIAVKRAIRDKWRKEAEQRVMAAAQGAGEEREGESCPACGARKGQPDYRPASHTLWVCLDCGHRW